MAIDPWPELPLAEWKDTLANDRLLQISFDFIDHLLVIETTEGSTKTIDLRPCSVAEFYHETMAALESLKMPVAIWTTPVEVPDRTPFDAATIVAVVVVYKSPIKK
jgi:hypothetical protein